MRRFGKFTKENTPILLTVLLGLRVLGTILDYVLKDTFLSAIVFQPTLILQGEVWRLFSFVLYPYGAGGISSLLFLAIATWFTFAIGRSLKLIIGEARLNFYLISGLVIEVILGFVYYYTMLAIPSMTLNAVYVTFLNPANVYYMLFVLFAMMFPDAQFLLMFIIPIKGKWLIFITLGLFLLDVVEAFVSAMRGVIGIGYAWILIVMIVAAVLAVILFMVMHKSGWKLFRVKSGSGAQKTANAGFAGRKTERPKSEDPVRMHRQGQTYRHKCTVCGRTEKTNPELEFRYCTKCIGNYEYCSDHLYTHLHKYPNVTDVGGKQ